MAKSKKKKAKAKNSDLKETLQKNGFWIAVSSIALASIVVWLMATMALAGRTKKNLSEIKRIDRTVKGIPSENPNQTHIDTLTAEIQTRIEKNHENWHQIYQAQQQVLVWPSLFQEDFRREVGKLFSPERLKGKGLTSGYRGRYADKARNQVKTLCSVIKAPYLVGRRKSGDNDAQLPPGSLVRWDAKSQQIVSSVLTFQANSDPSDQEILYAQEDYWIYSALIQIIANTNKKANSDGPHNTAIKRIETLFVSAEHVSSGDVDLIVLHDDNAGNARRKRRPSGDKEKIPKNLKRAGLRYVDKHGQKLTGEKLLALADEATEFKRVPIYMKLVIDNRHLLSLLSECNNSPLTVEVRKTPYSQSTAKRGADETKRTASGFYEQTIELYGTVYLFYPPPVTSDEADDDGVGPA